MDKRMSLENEDKCTLDEHAGMNCESKKLLKFSYTREFLLSLKELDACKKLPSGFDQSILSEFEDVSLVRPKFSGSLLLHGYRRNDYGSSPPTRGESGNYSQGSHGRWGSRSSGRSDKDSDSQSDWDSDSGMRYGNQSRRSWQVPEHDGLLGSGTFARPSGYAAGASASKFRTNDHYQLNKSNEPYHPPRPFKAVPHSRTNDSFNDETFGSSECTSEDRAEEERKRRASFELMRKEQQKAFQGKQKLNSDKHKDEFDITILLDGTKEDEGISSKSKQFNEPVLPAKNKDSDKSVLPAQAPASRPLVPPGFANASSERNHGTTKKTHSVLLEVERNHGTTKKTHSVLLEVVSSELEGGIFPSKDSHLSNGTLEEIERESAEQIGLSPRLDSMNIHASANNKSDKVRYLPYDLEVSNKTIGNDSQLYEKKSNLLKALDALEECESTELDAVKSADTKILAESNHVQPSSILDKLFGSVSTVNSGGSSGVVEQHEVKVDDMWSPHAVQSSKFAHWFLEEENKPVDDISSRRPNDLLSLIVGGEKGEFQPSDVNAAVHISSGFPSQSSELVDRHLSSDVSNVPIENSEQLPDVDINKLPAVPSVLTCEDLEQSILSEIGGSDETLRSPVCVSDGKHERMKENADEHASLHLLSLLQQGTGLKDVAPSLDTEAISSDKPCNEEVTSIYIGVNDSRGANTDHVINSGKCLTLQTLFGSAFMKELQSVGAPSSAQKGSVGSASTDASELHDGLLSSKLEFGSNETNYESNFLASNLLEPTKSDWMKKQFLGFDDRRIEADALLLQREGDSLIKLGDPRKQLGNPSSAPVGISEKLVVLNSSSFGDERTITGVQDGSPFLHGPNDMRERDISFPNFHGQQSSPQIHPQLNHVGPVLKPVVDPHLINMNSQMKLMAPDSIIHHDPPPGHQFPANMHRRPFLHPSSGLTGSNTPTHHHPILQQMQMPGSFPPPHVLRGFPSGGHLNNQMAGSMQDMKQMKGFPHGHRQPNFVGVGMPQPVPGIEGGTNNPETIQRLSQLELRSNPKQIHPVASAAGGLYNHELNTSFGYR